MNRPTKQMMKNYILIGLLFLTISCQKTDPLPAETQDGTGTLAFRVDGEIWKPRTNDFLSSSTSARYLKDLKTLYIGGRNTRTVTSIKIGLSQFDGTPRTYILDSYCSSLPRSNANCGNFSYDLYLDTGNDYWTNSLFRGKIVITKCSNFIVSGTFEFEAQHPQTKKTLKITEGRFDLRYIDYF
jgi:hypothetical protein